ncbi:hypothetical protein BGZ65_010919, partial [Modicella reniformis]
MLHVVCKGNLKVFFCGGDHRMVDYASSWIADRDLDKYPHLVDVLQGLTNVVTGLPDPIIGVLPNIIESLGLEDRILTPVLVRFLLRNCKNQWSTIVSSEARVEMLRYCIQDNKILDLEGLPLLPLAGGQWVEFSIGAASSRYFVDQPIFKVLSHSTEGLVDINTVTSPFEKFVETDVLKIYWSSMDVLSIGARIKYVYQNLCYKRSEVNRSQVGVSGIGYIKDLCLRFRPKYSESQTQTDDTIEQQPDGFPTDSWIKSFWYMTHTLNQTDRETLLSLLEGIHVLPITRQRLAPLSNDMPVVYLDYKKHSNDLTLTKFLDVLEDQLDCRVMRSDFFTTDATTTDYATAMDYVFEVTDATKVLNIVSRVETHKLYILEQSFCQVVCNYMAKWLSSDQGLNDVGLRTLKSLPIYRLYENSMSVPLQGSET